MEFQADLTLITVTDTCSAAIPLFDAAQRVADDIALEYIVVATRPDSAPQRPCRFPGLQCLISTRPHSLAHAFNQGIAAATGRYLSLWDQGVRFQDTALLELVNFMDNNPEVGIVAPQIRDPHGAIEPSARTLPGLFFLLLKFSGLLARVPDCFLLRRHLLTDWDHQSRREVPWLTASALLLRPEMIAEIGAFSPGCRMFYHDADFCRRASRAGWHPTYLPTARIIHDQPDRYIPFRPLDTPPLKHGATGQGRQILDACWYLWNKWLR